MKVNIKKFDVEMEVKNKGIEFEIRDGKDVFLGDVVLTRKGLIWCQGKTDRKNGKSIDWEEFIKWANSRP